MKKILWGNKGSGAHISILGALSSLALLFALGCSPVKRSYDKPVDKLKDLSETLITNTCTGKQMTVGQTAAIVQNFQGNNPETWAFKDDVCSFNGSNFRQARSKEDLQMDQLVEMYGNEGIYNLLYKDTCLVPSMASICDSIAKIVPTAANKAELERLKGFCAVGNYNTRGREGYTDPVDFRYDVANGQNYYYMDKPGNQTSFSGIRNNPERFTQFDQKMGDGTTRSLGVVHISSSEYATYAEQVQQNSVDAISLQGTHIILAHSIECPLRLTLSPIVATKESFGMDPASYSYNLPTSATFTIFNQADTDQASNELEAMRSSIVGNPLLPQGMKVNIVVARSTENGSFSNSSRLLVK